MNPGADVTSLDALREWYAALNTFRDEALGSLSAVAQEVQRAQSWVDDQLFDWQRELRRCMEALAQARAELANRRFPDFTGRIPDCSVQEKNVRRAEAHLEFVEGQIEICRRWRIQLPREVEDVYDGPAHRLNNFLTGEFLRAIARLDQQIISLEAYMDLKPAPETKP